MATQIVLAYPWPPGSAPFPPDTVLNIGTDITEWLAWRLVFDGHARFPILTGGLSVVDNGDGSYTVTTTGGASMTDNGDGSVTVDGGPTVITDNGDGTAGVAA